MIPQNALGTLNQVVLRVFVKSDDQENLDKLINKIRNTIKIYSIDGEEIGI